jgi:hypothetical protein
MCLDQEQTMPSTPNSLHKLLLQIMDAKLVSYEVPEREWHRGFME